MRRLVYFDRVCAWYVETRQKQNKMCCYTVTCLSVVVVAVAVHKNASITTLAPTTLTPVVLTHAHMYTFAISQYI